MKHRTLVFGVMAGLLIGLLTFGTASAVEYPDLSIWKGRWFKLNNTATVLVFDGIGVKPDPSQMVSETEPLYLKITGWNSTEGLLQVEIYDQDHKTKKWNSTPAMKIDFQYFAGTDLDFVASAHVESIDAVIGIAVRITGRGARRRTTWSRLR